MSTAAQQLKIEVERKGLDDGTCLPCHTIAWNGKNIEITVTRDGQNRGYSHTDWQRIGAKVEEMLKTIKAGEAGFDFSAAKLGVESGKFAYRPDFGQDIKTVDYIDVSTSVTPTVKDIKAWFSQFQGTPVRYVRDDLPKIPDLKNPAAVPPAAAPPAPPVNATPPADTRHWLKKKWDGFLDRFRKKSP